MKRFRSLKTRLLIVTICNTLISLSLSELIITLLRFENKANWFVICSDFWYFIILFLLFDIILNSITTPVILKPIETLTEDVQRVLKEKDPQGLDITSYPEMAKLISAAMEFVATAERQQAMALMIKSVSDSRAKTIRRDVLTGLFNREYLDRYLPDAFTRSRILHQPLSLVMLDVDDFKHYNDTNGHPEGDQVLIRVAEIIKKNTRDYDVCIRYGGEEFLIIMPHTPLYQAVIISERIRNNIEKEVFPFEKKQPLGNVTISLGVAAFPEHASEESQLIKRADLALYEAKRMGKNQVCAFQLENPA